MGENIILRYLLYIVLEHKDTFPRASTRCMASNCRNALISSVNFIDAIIYLFKEQLKRLI